MNSDNFDPMEITDEIEKLKLEAGSNPLPRKISIPETMLAKIERRAPHFKAIIQQLRKASEKEVPFLEMKISERLNFPFDDCLTPLELWALSRCAVGDPCSGYSSLEIGEIVGCIHDDIIPHKCEIIEITWAENDPDKIGLPIYKGRDIKSGELYAFQKVVEDFPDSEFDAIFKSELWSEKQ